MADSGRDIRDDYDVNDSGNFRSTYEFERAQQNGDVDESGYDRNGNHYNSWGDRDYDSGRDSYRPDADDSGK